MHNQKVLDYLDNLIEEGQRVLETKEYYNVNNNNSNFAVISLSASGYRVNNDLYMQWVSNINILITSCTDLDQFSKELESIKVSKIGTYTKSKKYMSLIKSIKNILDLGILRADESGAIKPEKGAPTINNYINNGGNQQNQSNTDNSTQNQNVYNTDRLKEFIKLYKEDKSKLDLSEGAGAYLDENIADLESELSQDSPNESVIKKCLASAKNVLEGCIGNVAASGLLQMI